MRRWARALHSARTFLAVSALVFGAAITTGHALADGQQVDDGWRRTAHGWERAEVFPAHDAVQFEHRFIFRRDTDVAQARWDFHPGFLAAGELILVLGALCMWRRVAARPVSGGARNGKHPATTQESRPLKIA